MVWVRFAGTSLTAKCLTVANSAGEGLFLINNFKTLKGEI